MYALVLQVGLNISFRVCMVLAIVCTHDVGGAKSLVVVATELKLHLSCTNHFFYAIGLTSSLTDPTKELASNPGVPVSSTAHLDRISSMCCFYDAQLHCFPMQQAAVLDEKSQKSTVHYLPSRKQQ